MPKFRIEYEIEAADVASATEFAHQLLFTSGMDVDRAGVVPLGEDKGRTFGSRPDVSAVMQPGFIP